jgi:hypothetical protein
MVSDPVRRKCACLLGSALGANDAPGSTRVLVQIRIQQASNKLEPFPLRHFLSLQRPAGYAVHRVWARMPGVLGIGLEASYFRLRSITTASNVAPPSHPNF